MKELEQQLKAEGELRERTAGDLICVIRRAEAAESTVKALERQLLTAHMKVIGC